MCCTAHAVQNELEDKRNAGNDRGGNKQHYSSFQGHETSKLLPRSIISKIKYISCFVLWFSSNQPIKLDWFTTCTFKIYF